MHLPHNLSSLAPGLMVLGATTALASAQEQFSARSTAPPIAQSAVIRTVADLNGDGRPDLIDTETAGSTRIHFSTSRPFDYVATSLAALGQLPTHIPQFADLDGDGDLDAVRNGLAPTVLLNDGVGGLIANTSFAVVAVESVLADFDLDGDVDVLAVGPSTTVYLNDGLGNLSVLSALPNYGLRPVAGDLDGDMFPDVVLNQPTGSTLLLNNAAGALVEGPSLPGSTSAVIADFDGDGDNDLVLGDSATSTISLWLNNGSAQFTQGAVAVTPSAFRVIAGDIDGDGDPDLLVDGTVLRNNGGVFVDVTATVLPTPRTRPAAIADMDGDGDNDLVYSDEILLQLGNGTFVPVCPVLPLEGTTSSIAQDLDGDGDVDALVTRGLEYMVALNDGTGRLEITPGMFPAGTGISQQATFLDFDGDGDADFCFVNSEGVRLFDNDGTGSFLDATANLDAALQTVPLFDVVAVDFDLDGDLDLAFAGDTPRLAENVAGQFVDVSGTAFATTTVRPSRHIAAVDVDNDGRSDLVLTGGLSFPPGGPSGNTVYLNGVASFGEAAGLLPTLATTGPIAAGDVDADGDLDLVVSQTNAVTVLSNDGTGSFQITGTLASGVIVGSNGELIDVDGDGDLDYLHGGPLAFAPFELFVNDGSGAFTQLNPSIVEAESFEFTAQALSPADFDGDGDVDVLVGNPPRVVSNLQTEIEAPAFAVIGQALDFEIFGRRAVAPVAANAAVPFVALGSASIPLPFGTLRVDPATLLVLPTVTLAAGSNSAIASVTIPNLTALVGLDLHMQALVVQVPGGIRLSNAAVVRFID